VQVKQKFDLERRIIIPYLINHLNEININKFGTPMKIVRYVNTSDMTIEFQDEFKIQRDTTYRNFTIGQILNPYDKKIHGVGYLGEGVYKAKYDNGRKTPAYASWHNMLERCYSEKDRYKHPSYESCNSSQEWHNYQTFADWYENEWYQIDFERMHLDKDILLKNNKLYSSETCLIVPQKINMIFTEQPNKYRLPSGISLTQSGKYHSAYNGIRLGNFEILEEAIAAHDNEKRIHIKELVSEYGSKLPKKVRDALLSW
jgi:hypothetical protein